MKYYIVPAEIIETNFPDMNTILQSTAIVETDKTITELAEDLLALN